MDRIFRVDFYPHEWLTMTGHMTPEQRGVFIQVCALIYAARGPIKNDPAHIGRISNCSPRLARAILEQLKKTGDLVFRGDFVTQKRCESELNLKRTLIEHGAKGGRKSAEKRAESNKNNEVDPSQDENPLPSPILPYPTPVVSDSKELSDTTPPTPKGGAVHDVFLRKYVMHDGTMLSLDGFIERLWLLYPAQRDKGHKGKAREQIIKKLKEGVNYETIGRGVARFKNYCDATGEKQPDMFRWIRDDGFNRPYDIPAEHRGEGSAASVKQTSEQQRRAALTEAALDLGLIEPGDVAITDVP